jgi:hypothetical protein
MTAMAIATFPELFRALAGPWPAAEDTVPVLAVFAGVAGAWLQAIDPPAAAREHDPVLLALLVV